MRASGLICASEALPVLDNMRTDHCCTVCCSLEAHDRVLDALFHMPKGVVDPDETAGTPVPVQVSERH